MLACVIPSIRPEKLKVFKKAWSELFNKHNVRLIVVWDGENPILEDGKDKLSVKDIMLHEGDLIYNKNDGVRNLGFAYVAKYLPEIEIIITLDDDVLPYRDTIQDHVDALNKRVSTKWISTASEYTRGFPYGVRNESEVVLSHGVWEGVKDWDAPTQLIKGNPDVTFYKGVIPQGILYPMCIMNVAFKRKMLPFMYQAPMGHRIGLDRFADIWCGIESKKEIDKRVWAVVSGYATVRHERASDVFTNLIKEGKGLQINENYGQDNYFKLYKKQRERWINFIKRYETVAS